MAPNMVPEIIILPEEFILADLRQYFLGGGQVKYRLNLRDGYEYIVQKETQSESH